MKFETVDAAWAIDIFLLIIAVSMMRETEAHRPLRVMCLRLNQPDARAE
ncbi:MAG: hypothetical protein ACRDOH_04005 [Streptosporangiaceae bacterium]